MVTKASIAQLSQPALRKAAEMADKLAGAGAPDGTVTTAEIDQALAVLKASPDRFGDVEALSTLRTFLVHQAAVGVAAALSGGGYSPVGLRTSQLTGGAKAVKDPVVLGSPSAPDAATRLFQVPSAERNIADKQSVLIPLEGKELHLIEVKFQDTRKLKDLEFNYREKGSYEWKTVRGDEWHALLAREKRGEVDIKREGDHHSPWVNNPIRVKVEVLFPDGRVHDIGKKFLDFHVHDAHSAESSGYPETDNISNGYERLPRGKLPEGCMLRMTPLHENRKPWEKDREIAMELSWVKPIYIPDHAEKTRIHKSYAFEKPASDGYAVDPDRKIAALMVRWTDNGGMASGSVSMKSDEGTWRSPSYNVGSGETELIPVGGYARDGRVHIQGGGVQVADIDVLYAE